MELVKRDILINHATSLIEKVANVSTRWGTDIHVNESRLINMLNKGATKILIWDSGYASSMYEDVSNRDSVYIESRIREHKYKSNMYLIGIED